MSRAERLFELYHFLDVKSGRSLEEIARRFGVSERTVFRDLGSLQEKGVLIEQADGRYRRMGGRPQAVALDSGELEIVRLAISNPAIERRRGPLGRALATLKSKLDAALHARQRPEPPSLSATKHESSAGAADLSSTAREVVLRFAAELAPLIEGGGHHPGEELRRIADGAIEYRVQASCLDQIARWVVGFGGGVRVESPPELAARVRELAAGVLISVDQAGASPRKR